MALDVLIANLRTVISMEATDAHRSVLYDVLAAAERAAADTAQIDAYVTASMALWDVPMQPRESNLLETIGHIAFGNEDEAVAVLMRTGAGR